MGIKRIIGCIVVAGILFACTLTYTRENKRLRITNDTGVNISELELINEDGKVLETLSVSAGKREFVELPKNDIINFLYHYDNKQSSESAEIRNKKLGVEDLDITISSAEKNGKLTMDIS
ncbi:MAG: hypothetical protein ACRC6T_11105 [Sarcina sp.]